MSFDGLTTWAAFNVGLVLCLLLRNRWRHFFGARAALNLWLLAPALALATCLPTGGMQIDLMRDLLVSTRSAGADAVVSSGSSAQIPWVAIWALGSLILAGAMLAANLRLARVWRQSPRLRFARYPHFDVVRADFGPALVGLWRPVLVLPHAFESRFDARQRELVLAHEAAHAANGDLRSRALAILLTVAQWWNPLAWLALFKFIEDQEIRCDEGVLDEFPAGRADYARALANSALYPGPRFISCSLHSSHPLLRRIAMLQKTARSPRQRQMGVTLAFALTLGCSAVSWAASGTSVVAKVDAASTAISIPLDAAVPVDADVKVDAQIAPKPQPEFPRVQPFSTLNPNAISAFGPIDVLRPPPAEGEGC